MARTTAAAFRRPVNGEVKKIDRVGEWVGETLATVRSLETAHQVLRGLSRKMPVSDDPLADLRALNRLSRELGIWETVPRPLGHRCERLKAAVLANASLAESALRDLLDHAQRAVMMLLEEGYQDPDCRQIRTSDFGDPHQGLAYTTVAGTRLVFGYLNQLPKGHWVLSLLPEPAKEAFLIEKTPLICLGPDNDEFHPQPYVRAAFAVELTRTLRQQQDETRGKRFRTEKEREADLANAEADRLRRLTPEGQLRELQQEVSELKQQLKEKKDRKAAEKK
jgi:hypothetical protein